ncbi:hypothetical protein E2C01_045950 [Portunus trituberculatus]|uniref:Uncharacterized protein n=1 Tax=Portunus trituberculatus TaxID=210409 RepID=A0A5B7FWH4_PORTR|nr:hypothetical protein [Portunus trituberculatus]
MDIYIASFPQHAGASYGRLQPASRPLYDLRPSKRPGQAIGGKTRIYTSKFSDREYIDFLFLGCNGVLRDTICPHQTARQQGVEWSGRSKGQEWPAGEVEGTRREAGK